MASTSMTFILCMIDSTKSPDHYTSMKRHTRVLNIKYIRTNEVIWGRHKIILAENPSGPGVRFYMEGRGPTLAIRGNRKVLTSLSPPPPLPYRSTA